MSTPDADASLTAAPDRCGAGSAPGPGSVPYRTFPCGPCPVRADNCDQPESHFPSERWEALGRTVRNPETGEQPGIWDALFGCHKGDPGTGDDLACAGWLARFGADHPRVRYLLFKKLLPASALEPGPNWPPLHETWSDVVRAHTLTEPGENLAHRMDETGVLDAADTTVPAISSTESPSTTGTSGATPETTTAADHASRRADAGERGNTTLPRKDSAR